MSTTPTPTSIELIVVGAPWCGPCKKVKTELPALLEDVADKLTITHLDVDDDEDVLDGLNITKIPTLVFRCSGEEKERFVGADSASLAKFVAKCKVHLSLDVAFGGSI